MSRIRNARRGGFTLVELLVGISIFLALAGLTLLLYPGARDQDRVRYAVSDIGAQLRMAQSMAARDKAPRGVRFVVNTALPDGVNPAKTNPLWVTEMQFIEQPLPLIPNRTPLSNSSNTYDPNLDPRVRFRYDVAPPGSTTPPAGTVQTRTCTIENLTAAQEALIQGGCTLVMPVFGYWSKITTVSPATASGSLFNKVVTLEVYPDAVMGGSTEHLTYQFAVYLIATPLVGEPTIPLPRNICVDLNVSIPQTSGTSHFDVLFAPDGKLVNAPGGQIFLWVRDYTKQAPYSAPGVFLTNTTTPTLTQALQQGGEQHVIMIRSSGAHGYNQVAWPDPSGTGTYAQGEAYRLAQQEIR